MIYAINPIHGGSQHQIPEFITDQLWQLGDPKGKFAELSKS